MLLFQKISVFCLFQICRQGNISFSPTFHKYCSGMISHCNSSSFNKRLPTQRIFVIYILKAYLAFSARRFYMLCVIVVPLTFSILRLVQINNKHRITVLSIYNKSSLFSPPKFYRYLKTVKRIYTNICEHCKEIDDLLKHYFVPCQRTEGLWQLFNSSFFKPAFEKIYSSNRPTFYTVY